MPVPWSDGPLTFAATWAFALWLANTRAPAHHIKQLIRWDSQRHEWRIEDDRKHQDTGA